MEGGQEGFSHLLRKATKVIDDGAVLAAISGANQQSRSDCGSDIIEIEREWDFLDRSRALYQLLLSLC